jgi:cytoskeletal protein CcmA (bactofilin family)
LSLFEKQKKSDENKAGYLGLNPPASKRATLGIERTDSGTIIGRNCKIKGDIVANEDVVIEGKIEGNIKVEKDLTINPNGDVKAQINANAVAIKGKIQGNINAKSRVQILSSGYLEGNIKAPAIIIAEGSFFKGNVDMGQTVEEKDKDLEKEKDKHDKPNKLDLSKLTKEASPATPLNEDKSKSEKKY